MSAFDRSVVRRKRWTPARIRKAIALPKPVGAIDKAEEYTLGKRLPDLTPLDSLALREIADVLDVAQTAECGRTQATRWLLVPAPMWLIEALAVFEADPEDLEPNQDNERGEDDEPSVSWLAGSLQQQRQSVEAAPHIGRAARQPDLRPDRNRDHRSWQHRRITRRSAAASTVSNVDPQTTAVTISSISIRPTPAAVRARPAVLGLRHCRRQGHGHEGRRLRRPLPANTGQLLTPTEQPRFAAMLCLRATADTDVLRHLTFNGSRRAMASMARSSMLS